MLNIGESESFGLSSEEEIEYVEGENVEHDIELGMKMLKLILKIFKLKMLGMKLLKLIMKMFKVKMLVSKMLNMVLKLGMKLFKLKVKMLEMKMFNIILI